MRKLELIMPLNFETKIKGVSNLKKIVGNFPHAFDYGMLRRKLIHRS